MHYIDVARRLNFYTLFLRLSSGLPSCPWCISQFHFLLEPWHRRVWKDPYTITLLVSFRLLQTEFRNLRRNFALWWYCLTRLVLSCENPLSFSFGEAMPLIWRYLLENQVYWLWSRDFHLFISFRNEKTLCKMNSKVQVGFLRILNGL